MDLSDGGDSTGGRERLSTQRRESELRRGSAGEGDGWK